MAAASWWLWAVAGAGAWLALNAAVGLALFVRADWFTDPGPYGSTWEGFNKQQFVGLVFFTFCAPPAFTLLFTAAQQTLRRLPIGRAYTAALFAALLALFILATLGGVWAATLLGCMVVGCVNPDTYPVPVVPVPAAGQGWQAIVGFSALFTSLGFAVALLLAALRNWQTAPAARAAGPVAAFASAHGGKHGTARDAPADDSDDGTTAPTAPVVINAGTHPAVARPVRHARALASRDGLAGDHGDADDAPLLVPWQAVPLVPAGHAVRRGWLLYALLLPLFLVFGFFTTYVPNSWEYFTPDRIAAFAAQKVTHNISIDTWPAYIPYPEYAWATFKTRELVLREYWRLKLFPDNVFLYVFFAVAPLAALLVRSVPALRRAAARGLWLPAPSYFALTLPLCVPGPVLGGVGA